jgi:hypothetical protein
MAASGASASFSYFYIIFVQYIIRLKAWRRRQIWFFLASARFLEKAPVYGGWILLDFLGFSRLNLDLSMRYTDLSAKSFSRAPFLMGEA